MTYQTFFSCEKFEPEVIDIIKKSLLAIVEKNSAALETISISINGFQFDK